MKGLVGLVIIGGLGYGTYSYIQINNSKIEVLKSQNTNLLNELNQIKQEKINAERREMQQRMDDIVFENSKLNKELEKLNKELSKNSKKSF